MQGQRTSTWLNPRSCSWVYRLLRESNTIRKLHVPSETKQVEIQRTIKLNCEVLGKTMRGDWTGPSRVGRMGRRTL